MIAGVGGSRAPKPRCELKQLRTVHLDGTFVLVEQQWVEAGMGLTDVPETDPVQLPVGFAWQLET